MQLPELLKKPLRPLRELALKLIYARSGMPVVVNGVHLRVDPSVRFLFTPSYDPEVTSILDSKIKPGMCCWNVGANVGIHALQLAQRVGPSGTVIAFEPNPYAAEMLRRNLSFNGCADRVRIVQAAVGEVTGTTDFFVAGFDGMGRAQRPNPLLGETNRISVPVITLDSYVKSQPRRPDCIIMDIEGWEIGALRGARTLLTAKPSPLWLIELHPDAWQWSGHSRKDLETLLRECGLSAAALPPQEDPLSQYGHILIH